jgi:cysteine-rich repeat protein
VRNDAQLTAADDTNADNDTDTLIIPHAVCGNGVVDLNETCDDGNTVGGDGCAADCGVCVDGDSDGACASVDCDDSDNLEYPGQTWYKDADTDNYSDGSSQVQCARPSNHYVSSELIALSGDCNDNDAFINPTTVWYKDLD